MGLGRLKKSIKSSWKTARWKKEQKRLIRLIEDMIRKSGDAVPELTAPQIAEIREFWGAYGYKDVPLQWHRFYYAKTGMIRPDFIPAPFFFQDIKPAMNDVGYGAVWSDKAYLDFFLKGTPTVECVLRNVNGRWLDADHRLISEKQAEETLSRFEELVVKPAVDTNTGKGVVLLRSPFSLEKIKESHGRNFVVQIPLRQHPEMAKLNESSVNTIRVNSVLLQDEAHVMSAFVKVGQAGAFADNSGHDRRFIGIREDGTFMDYAIDHDYNKYDAIPSGYDFAGRKIPSFDKICRTVEEAHRKIARFGFAFWDVCVSESGEPVIVEMNLKNPDSMVPQVCSGPFFGRYTEEILKFIRGRS